ncbi:MAG TPA: rodlin [Streptomyces sp.]|nr:rodlin [Streptomyces sp.]
MLKKAMVTVAVAASAAGVPAAAAPQALALGGGTGTAAVGGDAAPVALGDRMTRGGMSLRAALERTSPHTMCVGVPAVADVGSLVGVPAPVAPQEPAAASSPPSRTCAENSPRAPRVMGEEPLSGIRDAVPALSGNGGTENGRTIR